MPGPFPQVRQVHLTGEEAKGFAALLLDKRGETLGGEIAREEVPEGSPVFLVEGRRLASRLLRFRREATGEVFETLAGALGKPVETLASVGHGLERPARIAFSLRDCMRARDSSGRANTPSLMSCRKGWASSATTGRPAFTSSR